MSPKPKRVRALTEQQLRWVDLVISGETPPAASRTVGLDERKAYRLMANAKIKELLQKAGVKPPARAEYGRDAAVAEIDEKIKWAEGLKNPSPMAVAKLIHEKCDLLDLYPAQKIEVAKTIDLSAALKAAMARVASLDRPRIEAKPAIDVEAALVPEAELLKLPKPPSLMQEQIRAAQARIRDGNFEIPATAVEPPKPDAAPVPRPMPTPEPPTEDAQREAWDRAESARGFHNRARKDERRQVQDINYGIFGD